MPGNLNNAFMTVLWRHACLLRNTLKGEMALSVISVSQKKVLKWNATKQKDESLALENTEESVRRSSSDNISEQGYATFAKEQPLWPQAVITGYK